ncbi:MAG: PilZ domain-containing protein [bacterium]|nr:PilZ domain-containing protein [bacterium]
MKHSPREHQRIYLTFYLRVFEGDEFLGFMIDISASGLMTMSEFPLKEGKFYLLKMKLPSSLEWKDKKDTDRYIEFTAECKWSKHDEVEKEFYLSGFEFTELHDQENVIIHELIKEFRMR